MKQRLRAERERDLYRQPTGPSPLDRRNEKTGLAPWEFEFPFPGSLISTFRAGEDAGGAEPGQPDARAYRRPCTHPYTLHSTP